MGARQDVTHLTRIENPANLAHNWFIAAQICGLIENKTEVILKHPSIILLFFIAQFDWITNDPIVPRCTLDEPPTQWSGWNHIFGDVLEEE